MVNIFLNKFFSLSFLNVYVSRIRSSPTDSRTNAFSSFFLHPSLFQKSFLGDFNCHHPLWESKDISNSREEEVSDWVIFSDHFPLNDPNTPTLLDRSPLTSSLFLPDIFLAPSSLALSCSWEVLQDLGSDHLPILLTISLSLQRTPSILQFSESSLG